MGFHFWIFFSKAMLQRQGMILFFFQSVVCVRVVGWSIFILLVDPVDHRPAWQHHKFFGLTAGPIISTFRALIQTWLARILLSSTFRVCVQTKWCLRPMDLAA